jgi:hypothetical protein
MRSHFTENSKPQLKGSIRLQWDPDHYPNGDRHVKRRAIQLGLKGVQTFSSGEDILHIEDITPFVVEQRKFVSTDLGQLKTPTETLYLVEDTEVNKYLLLDDGDDGVKEEED